MTNQVVYRKRIEDESVESDEKVNAGIDGLFWQLRELGWCNEEDSPLRPLEIDYFCYRVGNEDYIEWRVSLLENARYPESSRWAYLR
ncbi:MAG: hypothetical protein Q8P81_00320 [Nanoarchaeota archaeon]|nr:hypothetical protein [Nanoarchaeota archaeon]